MITVTTHGMLYHQDTYTLVGVWPNSTNTLNAPSPWLMVRGKQKELMFKFSTLVRGVCSIYEHRNAPHYYMLKLYYSRQAMEEWWNEARGLTRKDVG